MKGEAQRVSQGRPRTERPATSEAVTPEPEPNYPFPKEPVHLKQEIQINVKVENPRKYSPTPRAKGPPPGAARGSGSGGIQIPIFTDPDISDTPPAWEKKKTRVTVQPRHPWPNPTADLSRKVPATAEEKTSSDSFQDVTPGNVRRTFLLKRKD